MKLELHWQILIAMVLGVVVGAAFQVSYDGQPSGWLFSLITALGTIFIRLLRMVIVPLIFSSIVSGVASVSDGKSIGRLGAKTFAYYFVSSLLAILLGQVLVTLIRPGAGAELGLSPVSAEALAERVDFLSVLRDIVPPNVFAALTDNASMLQLIFCALLAVFGAGIALVKSVADPTNQLPAITFWLLGSFGGALPGDLAVALPLIVVGLVPLVLLRWRIDLLALNVSFRSISSFSVILIKSRY